jgi:hypothetical protein
MDKQNPEQLRASAHEAANRLINPTFTGRDDVDAASGSSDRNAEPNATQQGVGAIGDLSAATTLPFAGDMDLGFRNS